MALLDLLVRVAAVVFVLHVVVGALVFERNHLTNAANTVRANVAVNRREIAALGGVLLLNRAVRNLGVDLSWLVGRNITGHIYAIEGTVVAEIQSFAVAPLTAYFSFVYVFGYAFLLVFPVVAYALHEEPEPVRSILVAYVVNYGLGVLCYVVLVAYGPRNLIPDLVESLLFTEWPQSRLLTRQVNSNTNVFPSLHTSLSVTVGLLAYRFRAVYPNWLPIAAALAASVTLATMYLGIHWLTDVLAGIVLAAVAVAVATRGLPTLRTPQVRWWDSE